MKNSIAKWNILLALGGLNPQIVTEALYCLIVQKRINIGKIVVLTTLECKDKIIEKLGVEVQHFARVYNFDWLKFSKDDVFWADEDFASTNPNPFAELAFKVVRDLTKEEHNTIHCLISGGRKTMSVDLATAMMLFAREKDKMYHILVSKDFEQEGKFFPETKEETKKLKLIEKPFLRLRSKISQIVFNEDITLSELIKFIQGNIDSSIDLKPLEFNIEKRSVAIGEKVAVLQPFPFAVYLFFAQIGKFIKGGKNFSRQHSEKLWKIYRRVATSQGQMERVRRYAYQNGLFDFEVIQKAISNIRKMIRNMMNNSPIADYYIISIEGTYSDKRYGIKLPKEKIIIKKN